MQIIMEDNLIILLILKRLFMVRHHLYGKRYNIQTQVEQQKLF